MANTNYVNPIRRGPGMPRSYYSGKSDKFKYLVGYNLDDDFELIKGFEFLDSAWYFYMHEFNLEGKLLVIKDQVENKFIWAEVMSKEFEY